MEKTKLKLLDDKVVVGVVFVITAIIFVTAFALLVASNSHEKKLSNENISIGEVSANYEAPWIHPSRHE